MKIIHFLNFDFRSNMPTLKAALEENNRWSRRNSYHIPIMVFIETRKVNRSLNIEDYFNFQVPDFLALEKKYCLSWISPKLLHQIMLGVSMIH
jgi:DUF1365 family protein